MARQIGRRIFLQGAGGILVGLPVLTSLPGRGNAAMPTAPKRFLCVVSHSGQINKQLYPISTPPGYQLTDTVFAGTGNCPNRPCNQDGTTFLHSPLPEDGRYAYAPLTDFQTNTGISTILYEALNPFLKKMTLLRGIDFLNGVGHSNGSSYLGNYNDAQAFADVRNACPPTVTIDEFMAYSSKVYSQQPVLRALHMCCGWQDGVSATNYGIAGGSVEAVSGFQDPKTIWQKLFSGISPNPKPTTDPNLSFMNAVYGDYQRLSKNARLGAHDRELLDRHVGFLNDIETRIKNFHPVVCTLPGQPPSIDGSERQVDPDQLKTVMGLMIDLAVAAVICDITRIVTLHVSNAINDGLGTVQTSLHNSADQPSDWHHYAHNAYGEDSSMKGLIAVNRWISGQVYGRLLAELDVLEGTDGSTYLDNSLVVWGNELGLDHYNVTMPTVMAGSAGGVVKTNRYIDYCDWKNGQGNPINQGILIPGLPHNRFLVTCMQAMGLVPSDYEQGGVPGYGSQAKLLGNSPNGWDTTHWDLDHIGDPLPGVLT